MFEWSNLQGTAAPDVLTLIGVFRPSGKYDTS